MQSNDANSCAICQRPQEEGVRYRPDGQGGLMATCPQCGTYGLGSVPAIAGSFSWSPEIKPALSCAAKAALHKNLALKGGK